MRSLTVFLRWSDIQRANTGPWMSLQRKKAVGCLGESPSAAPVAGRPRPC